MPDIRDMSPSRASAPADADPRFRRPERLFFGIGAQKSGTTWIYRYLRAHPEVCLPVRKEMHYWDTLHAPVRGRHPERIMRELRKIGGRGAVRQILRSPRQRRRDRAWQLCDAMLGDRSGRHEGYAAALFQKYRKEPVVGEITPSYALLPGEVFAEMASLAPDVRFVFVMRDPVDRLLSGVRRELRREHGSDAINGALVARALTRILERPEDHNLGRSRYDRTIGALEGAVSPDRIGYFFYETLFSETEVGRLSRFLGIAARPAMMDLKVNEGRDRDTRVPDDVTARARDVLAPVYEFMQGRFGNALPDAWRQGTDGRSAASLSAACM